MSKCSLLQLDIEVLGIFTVYYCHLFCILPEYGDDGALEHCCPGYS